MSSITLPKAVAQGLERKAREAGVSVRLLIANGLFAIRR